MKKDNDSGPKVDLAAGVSAAAAGGVALVAGPGMGLAAAVFAALCSGPPKWREEQEDAMKEIHAAIQSHESQDAQKDAVFAFHRRLVERALFADDKERLRMLVNAAWNVLQLPTWQFDETQFYNRVLRDITRSELALVQDCGSSEFVNAGSGGRGDLHGPVVYLDEDPQRVAAADGLTTFGLLQLNLDGGTASNPCSTWTIDARLKAMQALINEPS